MIECRVIFVFLFYDFIDGFDFHFYSASIASMGRKKKHMKYTH